MKICVSEAPFSESSMSDKLGDLLSEEEEKKAFVGHSKDLVR
jgi:hypothetical protein